MFPDSNIAKEFSCGRTKATAIIKALANYHSESIVTHAKMGLITLVVDESNDVCNDKVVCIMIRYFHQTLKVVKTDLLTIEICNVANAGNLFSGFCSSPHGRMLLVSLLNLLTSRLGKVTVLSWVKQQLSSMYSLPCVSHIVHLAVKVAVKAVSKPVEDLVVDIFLLFQW